MQGCFIFILLLLGFVVAITACGQKYTQHQLLYEREPTHTPGRLLLTEAPHAYKIYGEFPQYTNATKNLDLIKTIFGVAVTYYSKIIQVTRLHDRDTLFPESSGTCGVTVPEKYSARGFNQSIMDLVIFILIENSVSLDYVSAAAPCIKIRRPTYGYIIFNSAYISPKPTDYGKFHRYITVTIHELAHTLAMRPQYFNSFYENPTGPERRSIDRVIRNVSDRSFIITPRVTEYVKKHFGCSQEIGALLEEEGGPGSAICHWERKVFMDDMMTASDLPQGLRISPITLHLMADSNFYSHVDTGAADAAFWGKERGCEFAQGMTNNQPEFRRHYDLKMCNFYETFGGYSTDKDYFGSKAIYALAYPRLVCNFPENADYVSRPSSETFYTKFSSSSRCFEVVDRDTQKAMPSCYQANCNNSGIVIKVGNKEGVCVTQNVDILINGLVLKCPGDFQRFCSHKPCAQWCNLRGLCLNGTCICNPPYFGSECTQSCPKYFDFSSSRCVEECNNNQILHRDFMCMSVCPPGFRNVGGECEGQYSVARKWQEQLGMGVLMWLGLVGVLVL